MPITSNERRRARNSLAAGRQNLQDIAARSDRDCPLCLALRHRIRQVTVPAREQRSQAIAAVCCCCTTCHALLLTISIIRHSSDLHCLSNCLRPLPLTIASESAQRAKWLHWCLRT